MIFLDTSVLVAVAQVHHVHHTPSAGLWNRCTRSTTAVSTHTLAELFNALTSMPPALRISPRSAVQAIETFLQRLTPVELTANEYLETIRRVARLGHSGGMIYDALHLACASKIAATEIFTWNINHFRQAAPDLTDRILTP